MFEAFKEIILINAFWFSLPLIGYAILHFVRNWKKGPVFVNRIASLALRQYVLIVFLLSFTLTIFCISIVSVFFYIFHAPPKLAAIIYLACLLVSCLYLGILFARNLFNKRDFNVLGLRDRTVFTKVLVLLLCLALVVDFAVSLYAKSNVGGDTIYHMSRILSILNNGFNMQSGFFSNLPEGSYHYNVIYTLYVVAAKLFHLEPIKVWEYSLGFFRLLQWLAIFTLSTVVYKHWLRLNLLSLPLSVLSVISSIAIYAAFFFTATYQNQIVNIWLILFVVCLSFYKTKDVTTMGVSLISLGFLITMTHPSYALAATCFTLLLMAIQLVQDKRHFFVNKRKLILYVVTLTTLMIGPLITKLLPNRLNSGQLHLNEPAILHAFGIYIKKPINIIPIDMLGWLVLAAGIAATVFLLVNLRRRKTQWSVVFACSFFFPIVVYTPMFTIFYGILPVWLIERFTAMNGLVYLYVPLGLYAVYCFFGWVFQRFIRFTYKQQYADKVFLVLLTAAVLFFSACSGLTSYKGFLLDRQMKSDTYVHIDKTTLDFKNILTNRKVVVADSIYSYYLGALFPVNVIAVEIGHSAVAADATDRLKCQEGLMKNLNYEDLMAVGADYVAIPSYAENRAEKSVADSKSYLDIVANNQDFYIYSFEKTRNIMTAQPNIACIQYQQAERQ